MNVWFNHWFSTAYHFIDMLKEKGYYVISTNERNTCIYKTNSDEFYLEPIFNNSVEYLNYCISFCKQHNIDIFFVKRNMETIIRYIDLFKDIGVKVICEKKYNMFSINSSKEYHHLQKSLVNLLK